MKTLIAVTVGLVLSLSIGLAREGILPFVLNLSPQDDGVILQGSVPSKDQKKAIYDAAVGVLGDERVDNRLKLSPSTINEPWIDELPGLITSFLQSYEGKADFTVVDGKVILGGDIGDRKKYEILRGEISGEAPKALAFEDRITVDGVRMMPPELVPEEPVEQAIAKVEKEVPPKMTIAAASEPPVQAVAEEKAVPELPTPKKKLKYFGPVSFAGDSTRVVAAAKAKAPEPVAELKMTKENSPSVSEKEEQPEAVPEPAAPKPAMAKSEQSIPGKSEAAADEVPEKKVAVLENHGSDPGGPLLFYFATGSAEIRPEDRHKIEWAMGRCQRSRTILYVTGYADYRGSYALNRALTNQRTENVRDAIFSGDVADDLKAELEAKGDEQSESRDAWKSKDSEAALQYSRRVVVETYQLK